MPSILPRSLQAPACSGSRSIERSNASIASAKRRIFTYVLPLSCHSWASAGACSRPWSKFCSASSKRFISARAIAAPAPDRGIRAARDRSPSSRQGQRAIVLAGDHRVVGDGQPAEGGARAGKGSLSSQDVELAARLPAGLDGRGVAPVRAEIHDHLAEHAASAFRPMSDLDRARLDQQPRKFGCVSRARSVAAPAPRRAGPDGRKQLARLLSDVAWRGSSRSAFWTHASARSYCFWAKKVVQRSFQSWTVPSGRTRGGGSADFDGGAGDWARRPGAGAGITIGGRSSTALASPLPLLARVPRPAPASSSPRKRSAAAGAPPLRGGGRRGRGAGTPEVLRSPRARSAELIVAQARGCTRASAKAGSIWVADRSKRARLRQPAERHESVALVVEAPRVPGLDPQRLVERRQRLLETSGLARARSPSRTRRGRSAGRRPARGRTTRAPPPAAPPPTARCRG